MSSVGGRSGRAIAVLLGMVVLSWLAIAAPAQAESADNLRAKAERIADRLAELQDDQMELSAKYERASYEQHLAEERVAEAQEESDRTQAELEAKREQLRDFSVSAYASGNDGATGAALMADDANTGAVKRFYLEKANGDRTDLIDALKNAQRAAEEDIASLEEARSEAQAYVDEIEEARAAAAEATAQQDDLNSSVQGELAELVAQEAAARATTTTQPQTAAAAGPNLAGAPASSPPAASRPRSAPAPAPVPAPSPAPPPPSGSKASGAISAALSKIGSPYVWGAAGPNAFDCSGLVMWAYARVGVSLPHYSGAQYNVTTRISASQLQPGDLVFWGPGGSDHVAIYMGGNQLVHAFGSGGGVGTTHLNGWWKPPSGYGRIHF